MNTITTSRPQLVCSLWHVFSTADTIAVAWRTPIAAGLFDLRDVDRESNVQPKRHPSPTAFGVEYCNRATGNWVHYDETCSSIVVLSGLRPGSFYSVRVRAMTLSGWGPWRQTREPIATSADYSPGAGSDAELQRALQDALAWVNFCDSRLLAKSVHAGATPCRLRAFAGPIIPLVTLRGMLEEIYDEALETATLAAAAAAAAAASASAAASQRAAMLPANAPLSTFLNSISGLFRGRASPVATPVQPHLQGPRQPRLGRLASRSALPQSGKPTSVGADGDASQVYDSNGGSVAEGFGPPTVIFRGHRGLMPPGLVSAQPQPPGPGHASWDGKHCQRCHAGLWRSRDSIIESPMTLAAATSAPGEADGGAAHICETCSSVLCGVCRASLVYTTLRHPLDRAPSAEGIVEAACGVTVQRTCSECAIAAAASTLKAHSAASLTDDVLRCTPPLLLVPESGRGLQVLDSGAAALLLLGLVACGDAGVLAPALTGCTVGVKGSSGEHGSQYLEALRWHMRSSHGLLWAPGGWDGPSVVKLLLYAESHLIASLAAAEPLDAPCRALPPFFFPTSLAPQQCSLSSDHDSSMASIASDGSVTLPHPLEHPAAALQAALGSCDDMVLYVHAAARFSSGLPRFALRKVCPSWDYLSLPRELLDCSLAGLEIARPALVQQFQRLRTAGTDATGETTPISPAAREYPALTSKLMAQTYKDLSREPGIVVVVDEEFSAGLQPLAPSGVDDLPWLASFSHAEPEPAMTSHPSTLVDASRSYFALSNSDRVQDFRELLSRLLRRGFIASVLPVQLRSIFQVLNTKLDSDMPVPPAMPASSCDDTRHEADDVDSTRVQVGPASTLQQCLQRLFAREVAVASSSLTSPSGTLKRSAPLSVAALRDQVTAASPSLHSALVPPDQYVHETCHLESAADVLDSVYPARTTGSNSASGIAACRRYLSAVLEALPGALDNAIDVLTKRAADAILVACSRTHSSGDAFLVAHAVFVKRFNEAGPCQLALSDIYSELCMHPSYSGVCSSFLPGIVPPQAPRTTPLVFLRPQQPQQWATPETLAAVPMARAAPLLVELNQVEEEEGASASALAVAELHHPLASLCVTSVDRFDVSVGSASEAAPFLTLQSTVTHKMRLQEPTDVIAKDISESLLLSSIADALFSHERLGLVLKEGLDGLASPAGHAGVTSISIDAQCAADVARVTLASIFDARADAWPRIVDESRYCDVNVLSQQPRVLSLSFVGADALGGLALTESFASLMGISAPPEDEPAAAIVAKLWSEDASAPRVATTASPALQLWRALLAQHLVSAVPPAANSSTAAWYAAPRAGDTTGGWVDGLPTNDLPIITPTSFDSIPASETSATAVRMAATKDGLRWVFNAALRLRLAGRGLGSNGSPVASAAADPAMQMLQAAAYGPFALAIEASAGDFRLDFQPPMRAMPSTLVTASESVAVPFAATPPRSRGDEVSRVSLTGVTTSRLLPEVVGTSAVEGISHLADLSTSWLAAMLGIGIGAAAAMGRSLRHLQRVAFGKRNGLKRLTGRSRQLAAVELLHPAVRTRDLSDPVRSATRRGIRYESRASSTRAHVSEPAAGGSVRPNHPAQTAPTTTTPRSSAAGRAAPVSPSASVTAAAVGAMLPAQATPVTVPATTSAAGVPPGGGASHRDLRKGLGPSIRTPNIGSVYVVASMVSALNRHTQAVASASDSSTDTASGGGRLEGGGGVAAASVSSSCSQATASGTGSGPGLPPGIAVRASDTASAGGACTSESGSPQASAVTAAIPLVPHPQSPSLARTPPPSRLRAAALVPPLVDLAWDGSTTACELALWWIPPSTHRGSSETHLAPQKSTTRHVCLGSGVFQYEAGSVPTTTPPGTPLVALVQLTKRVRVKVLLPRPSQAAWRSLLREGRLAPAFDSDTSRAFPGDADVTLSPVVLPPRELPESLLQCAFRCTSADATAAARRFLSAAVSESDGGGAPVVAVPALIADAARSQAAAKAAALAASIAKLLTSKPAAAAPLASPEAARARAATAFSTGIAKPDLAAAVASSSPSFAASAVPSGGHVFRQNSGASAVNPRASLGGSTDSETDSTASVAGFSTPRTGLRVTSTSADACGDGRLRSVASTAELESSGRSEASLPEASSDSSQRSTPPFEGGESSLALDYGDAQQSLRRAAADPEPTLGSTPRRRRQDSRVGTVAHAESDLGVPETAVLVTGKDTSVLHPAPPTPLATAAGREVLLHSAAPSTTPATFTGTTGAASADSKYRSRAASGSASNSLKRSGVESQGQSPALAAARSAAAPAPQPTTGPGLVDPGAAARATHVSDSSNSSASLEDVVPWEEVLTFVSGYVWVSLHERGRSDPAAGAAEPPRRAVPAPVGAAI